ncbi:protein BOLA2 [Vitis vinifera]|uniref:protein BOLA2 n=1 Tax=Vitis vinifera TaxID=29760 RepID=UPI0001983323|nr:protein BOLA2 [Vitis vinifera]|eukprot:XP_002282729.1 PREDICTED: protein BOLA2 isoform X1 [Vitis vinifera]
MGVTKEDVESSLTSVMNPSHLAFSITPFSFSYSLSAINLILIWINILSFFVFQEVIDTSGGCGASFAIEIVSEQFEGKRLLERHRMVNAALQEELKQIHALSIKKALTPEQWKQQQEAENSQPAA